MIRIIIRNIQDMNQICNPKRRHTSWEGVILDILRVPIKQIAPKHGKWPMWEKPVSLGFKLNTDGSSK